MTSVLETRPQEFEITGSCLAWGEEIAGQTPRTGGTTGSAMGISIAVADTKELQLIQEAFRIPKSDVLSFLSNNPILSSIVLFARVRLSEFFDINRLSLEVVYDPEGVESPFLSLVVPTELSGTKAYLLWETFLKNFSIHLSACKGALIIDLKFE